jgi:hypothetical protein
MVLETVFTRKMLPEIVKQNLLLYETLFGR